MSVILLFFPSFSGVENATQGRDRSIRFPKPWGRFSHFVTTIHDF